MGELSSGNRQKIGLVQAFMHRPELVILEEPITGLDPLGQNELHALMGELRDAGRTVVLSSHTLLAVLVLAAALLTLLAVAGLARRDVRG